MNLFKKTMLFLDADSGGGEGGAGDPPAPPAAPATPPATPPPAADGAPPAPPPAQTDPPAGEGEVGEEWKGWWGAQLPKDTRDKHKDGLLALKGKQLGEVFDDYFSSRTKLQNAVLFPGKDAKPEEIEAFLKRMDIPKSAAEYGLDPKQIPTPDSDDDKAKSANEIAEFFRGIGLTKNQSKKMYEKYLGIIKGVIGAGEARRQSMSDTFEERLVKDAGDVKSATETKEYFKRALIALNDKNFVREINQSGMLYSTAFVRGIADIWKAGNHEPPVVQGQGGGEAPKQEALPKSEQFNKHYGNRR
jgi:hypothetical protein